MSIGIAVQQTGRRRYEYCDIWDLVAPHLACPACGGEVAERWEREAAEASTTASSTEIEGAPPLFQDLPGQRGDVRTEAEMLLGLLAS